MDGARKAPSWVRSLREIDWLPKTLKLIVGDVAVGTDVVVVMVPETVLMIAPWYEGSGVPFAMAACCTLPENFTVPFATASTVSPTVFITTVVPGGVKVTVRDAFICTASVAC